MNSNKFFKPTPLFKEYLILDLVEKQNDITQRELSKEVNASLSMINLYLDRYEEEGYITKKYITSKNVRYIISNKGIERKKVLNIGFLSSAQVIYKEARENVMKFLKEIHNKGLFNIILYGAGEVAEIFLQTINDNNKIPINVVRVIDDDKDKINTKMINVKISSINDILTIKHDAVLITSHPHRKAINKKLIDINYPKDKILHFFK